MVGKLIYITVAVAVTVTVTVNVTDEQLLLSTVHPRNIHRNICHT